MCLATADWNDIENGVDAIIYEWNGCENQMWRFEPTADDCYKIVSKYSDKCLEVSDGSTENYAAVQQFDYRGQDHQMWRVIDRDNSGLVMLYPGWLSGNFRSYVKNTSDLGDYNERASNIKVAPGYAAILYDLPNYLGRSKIFIGRNSDASNNEIGDDFIDNASSLEIVKIDELGPVRIMKKDLMNGERHYLVGKGGPAGTDQVYAAAYREEQYQSWKLEPACVGYYRIVSVGSENDGERCVLFANDGDVCDLSWRVDAITDNKCLHFFKPNLGYYFIVDGGPGRSMYFETSGGEVSAEIRGSVVSKYEFMLTR